MKKIKSQKKYEETIVFWGGAASRCFNVEKRIKRQTDRKTRNFHVANLHFLSCSFHIRLETNRSVFCFWGNKSHHPIRLQAADWSIQTSSKFVLLAVALTMITFGVRVGVWPQSVTSCGFLQGLFGVCGLLTGCYCCCCLCCCCNCCCGKLKPTPTDEGAESDYVSPDDLEEEIRNNPDNSETTGGSADRLQKSLLIKSYCIYSKEYTQTFIYKMSYFCFYLQFNSIIY